MVSVSLLARFNRSLALFFCFEFFVLAWLSFCALGWRNMAAIIYNLFVINKSGGLIFYKDYGTQGRLDTNDSLRLASLWHSMHAISKELSPVGGCTGIELLEADTFDLHCFQALTGTKIFVAAEPGTPGMDNLLRNIYELYTDYVLKNPFYEVEMPIRCELWDLNLALAVRKDGKASLTGR